MRARIEVTGSEDVQADVASLREWLDGEPKLRGAVHREPAPLRDDEMGGVADVLVAALGDGGAIAALAAAVGTWLGTRRSKVTLRVTGRDGETVEVDVQSKNAEAVLRAVLEDPE
ncbi:effector-associated constant component EACC1 [Amycolatopsis nigrescens]|uniref:effector-associated constant component EACC1 n=1 Tax=Amycolatopsis nigrescens TaxID=381445 RepID=UPI00035FD8E3|nr:hypothetical protein [Amycolatopsis nigrescens]